LKGKIKEKLNRDYRSDASIEAYQSIFAGMGEDALIVSIGGGPSRPRPDMVNLNIGPFENVDIVADAHLLPYADSSVDAIYCDAVLEHLHDPVVAVREMLRVLKPGRRAFATTPFMQAYHGYPHHYQNFTITGHKNLFGLAGFVIRDAGTCAGPLYTIVSTVSIFIREYSPRLLRKPFKLAWDIVDAMIRPFDRILNKRENAYVLASTTYVLAEKPL
jgi:SAM-dependent methyltransferase